MSKMRPWLIAFAVLLSGDLITTYIGGIAREANPLVVYMWAQWGFWLFVVIKALLLLLFAGTWWLLGKLADISPWWPPASVRKVYRAILVIEALVPMSAVCLWNIYQLT